MNPRQTHYSPSSSRPEWQPLPPPVGETRAVHLRLTAANAHFLALARVESEATAETLIEALLEMLQAASPETRQAIYQRARRLATTRKNQGLEKRKKTYQGQP